MPHLYGDPEKCTGCKICELYCAQARERVMNPKRARLRIFRGHRSDRIEACRQCVDAPCAEACPQEAIVRNQKTGIVFVNESKCDGCGVCVVACPYEMIWVNPDRGKAIKCDLCKQCIAQCPTGALSVVQKEWSALKDSNIAQPVSSLETSSSESSL
ncbi:MAG: 4Fe-4S dicluster domain-containing protein [Candidatus Hadarchaeota archaeon]